jgi:glucose dehydrogenase
MTDLAERYGAPPRAGRPLLLALVAVLVIAAAAWLVWAIGFHGRPEVSSQMVGFTTGEHRATAEFTVVRRNADVPASCLLQAYASDHSVVGELTVPVGRDRPGTSTVHASMRTERRATSVDLVGCTAAGQDRPR